MLIVARAPRPPLNSYVQQLWLAAGYTTHYAFDRMLPSASMSLIVNLAEDCCRIYDAEDRRAMRSTDGTIVVGAFSLPFVIDTAEQTHVIGATFKLGGAFPFFKLPMSELADQHV